MCSHKQSTGEILTIKSNTVIQYQKRNMNNSRINLTKESGCLRELLQKKITMT